MPARLGLEFGGLSVLANTERCPACGRHVGRERATFRATQKPDRPFPLSVTSDGFHVASKRFRGFCIDHAFTGIDFVPLENGYFVMIVARCVAYDLSRLTVTQEDWCPTCRTYRRNLVANAPRPIAADEGAIAPLEIVESCQRWGVEVGERTAQHPDIIVGCAAWKALEAAGFKGLYFVETI